MKVLGIVGRGDMPLSHDGSAALIIDNEIACAIEQERLTRSRYAMGQGCAAAAKACLDYAGLELASVDRIAYGWICPEQGTWLNERILSSPEHTEIILPRDLFGYRTPPTIDFVQHHYAHAAATFMTSGFDSAAVLIIDGQGEGESISLYHARPDGIALLESYPVDYSLGMFYGAASARSGLGWHPGPGKLMGLAPFGQVRERLEFSFDPATGRFSLPRPIQQAIDDAPVPPSANQMGELWCNYFDDYHYPYRHEWQNQSQPVHGYHIAHYVDFAAMVQRTLEAIVEGLVVRLKDLTGERNLALHGGCALNCTMNALLSRHGTFERIYAFPAANDAGCSVGAALAVSAALGPRQTTHARLIAPDLGFAYGEEAILAALARRRLIAQRLPSEELAHRVARDLAENKICAWFRGRDELGPRALGRRSFLANPTQRSNLGRLNTIKGREMWRPLAPSILAEHAPEVLEGPLDPGIHRYMLGAATIRESWRRRIPAVVHVDFTTRPHLVEQAHDGAYWQVIDGFRALTGIPLVCNTSLNVAGQPLVHTPDDVLDVFLGRDDVQTLVIEDFYLTRP